MRIAILSTALPIPPETYGGTERVVFALTHGLIARGHNVTLFTHQNSKVDDRIIKIPIEISQKEDMYLKALVKIGVKLGNFDIVHDHSNDGFINYRRWLHRPYLSTVHGEDHFNQMNRVYISQRQRSLQRDFCAPVVYHGFDGARILFREKKKNYLFWIGRIDWLKVPHLAIEVAKKSNHPLILAGPICDQKYFEQMIEPELNEKIRWIGAIGFPHKDEIFADAKALIFPCNWREPCGLVLLESLFAGTPIIAQDNGLNAVHEIIKDGVSGFICQSVDQMVEAVFNLDTLDNRLVRQTADERFTQDRMVDDYLSLYERVIKGEIWD